MTIVEKGRNHLLDPDDPTRPSSDFSNDEIKFRNRYFLGPDPLVEPRTFRASEADGERTFVGEVNFVPSTVGGGGTHADGKVPRFRPDDFRLLSRFGPQEDADVADWPLDYDELEPYYAEVERLVGVAGTDGANPFAAPRSGPFPMPSGAPMFGATRSAAAAERLGYHPYPAPTAANSIPYDGRPACNNCGFCSFSGCPIHAKGDPVAMLLRVMATGRAELLAETFVSRIRTEGDRATGVDVVGPDGTERFLPARHVVVAAGAIETARLLLLSGFEHPLIGRYLMVHFQTIAAGGMPYRTFAERGRAVTHVHDDMIVGDDAVRGPAAADGRTALAARGPGRAQRRRLPHPGGHPLPVGEEPHAAHGRLTHPLEAVGLHHAGRGPALRHEPRRPRPHGARRPGVPRRPGHLPGRAPRARGLRPLRPAAGGHPEGDGSRVDGRDHVTGWGQRRVARGRTREPAQRGDGPDGHRPDHVGGRPVRSACTSTRTSWWPTRRCSSPRPATGRRSPWWRWPHGPPTCWPAPGPPERTRPTQPRPRVSSSVPAIGPPPLADRGHLGLPAPGADDLAVATLARGAGRRPRG